MENIRYKRNELCLKKMLICLGIFGNLYHVVILIALLLLVFIFKAINEKIAIKNNHETFIILL